jgi:hypothetical protein
MTTQLQTVADAVLPGTKLGSLLGRLAKSETPLPVIENDKLWGTIDQRQVMMVLANDA